MAREIVTSENREQYIADKLSKKDIKNKKRSKLPYGESLSIPEAPNKEQLKKHGRIEKVFLNKVRGTQPKMDWENFESGKHPKELIEGYADKPVAVRKENGEYLIYDGHHRTVLAIDSGKKHIDMHVIDAKNYAPEFAGKKPAKDKMTTDDLLKELS
jgi:hypothetical protein